MVPRVPLFRFLTCFPAEFVTYSTSLLFSVRCFGPCLDVGGVPGDVAGQFHVRWDARGEDGFDEPRRERWPVVAWFGGVILLMIFRPDEQVGDLFVGEDVTVRVDDVQLPLRFWGHGEQNLPRTPKVSVVVALQSNNDDPDHQAAQRELSFVAVVIVELGLYAPKDSSVGGMTTSRASAMVQVSGVVPSSPTSWLLRPGRAGLQVALIWWVRVGLRRCVQR